MLVVLFAGAMILTPAPAAASAATECGAMPEVTTSEVSVQVYALAPKGGVLEPFQGVEITLVARGGQTTAATDVRGYMRFSFVSPGRYELRVRAEGFAPIYRRLRVVEAGSAPARMITAALLPGFNCSLSCSVTAPREGLSKAPDCLTPKPKVLRKQP